MYFFRTFFQFLQDNFFNSSLNGNYQYLEITQTTTTLLMIVGGFCLGFVIAAFMIYIQKKTVSRFMKALLDKECFSPEKAASLDDLGFGTDKTVRAELSRASVTRKLVAFIEGERLYTFESELMELFPEGIKTNEDKPRLTSRIKALFCRPKKDETSILTSKEEESISSSDTPTDADEADGHPSCADTYADEEAPTENEQGNTSKSSLKEKLIGKKFSLHRPDFSIARFFIPSELRYRAEVRFNKNDAGILWPILSLFASLALFLLALKFIPVLVNMLDMSIGNLLG